MFAAVHKTGQDIIETVDLFLVDGKQAVKILCRKLRGLGFRHTEKLGIVGRHVFHIIFESVQDPLFFFVHVSEKTGLIVMDLGRTRGIGFVFFRRIDKYFSPLLVKISLGGHTAEDAAAAHGDVTVFMGKQNGGADSLIPAAGGIGTVDAGQHRNSHLRQFRMPEKSGPGSPAVCIEFFLCRQFDPAAVDQPYQGQIETFGKVGDPIDIFGLARYPGTREHLIIETDDHRPFPGYLSQTVKDIGGPFFIFLRVINGMQRTPGSRIQQIFQPLPHGQLSSGIDLLFGYTHGFGMLNRLGDFCFFFPDLFDVFLGTLDLFLFERPADIRHLFKIGSHDLTPYSIYINLLR